MSTFNSGGKSPQDSIINDSLKIGSTSSIIDFSTLNQITLKTNNVDRMIINSAGNLDIASHNGSIGLKLGGTLVTATAAEINVMDGDTSASSITLADADRVVVNDGGTMKQVALTDFETYFENNLDTLSTVTTVGALNSGSITSGFGAIDNGGSNITTTGIVTFGSLTDGSITITAFVDEDNMSSNSATLIPTQQSVKAYVDSQSGGSVTVSDSNADTNFPVVFHNESNGLLDDTGAFRYNPSTGLVLAPLLAINGTTITATAAELNLMDGGSTIGTTAVADGHGIVMNHGGTMAQTTVQTLAAYLDDEITAMPNLVSVGALNSGSITSGFGHIDNGGSNITTGGLFKIDVDADADDISGDSATGRLTIGAGEDLNLYHGGTNSYIVNDTGDLIINTAGAAIFNSTIYRTKTTSIPTGLQGSGTELNIFTVQTGPEITTYIKIDITGLTIFPSSFSSNRILHKPSSTADSYLLQWSNSTNGVLTYATINCLETPTSSTSYLASTLGVGYWSTGTVDGTELYPSHNSNHHVSTIPALAVYSATIGKLGMTSSGVMANLNSQYFYLYCDETVSGQTNYTAGKFVIKLLGYDPSF